MLRFERLPENDTRQERVNGYFTPTYRTNSMADLFYILTLELWNKIHAQIKDNKKTEY